MGGFVFAHGWRRTLAAVAAGAAAVVWGVCHPNAAPGAQLAGATASGRIAGSVLAQLNHARAARGLRVLRRSSALARAAAAQARAMAQHGYFSHASPNGASPAVRIRRYYHGSLVGETILWRSPAVSARAAVRIWLRSSVHRQILLRPGFRVAGIAALHVSSAPGVYRRRPVTILVADLGAP